MFGHACVCVCARARACVRACMRVCVFFIYDCDCHCRKTKDHCGLYLANLMLQMLYLTESEHEQFGVMRNYSCLVGGFMPKVRFF